MSDLVLVFRTQIYSYQIVNDLFIYNYLIDRAIVQLEWYLNSIKQPHGIR